MQVEILITGELVEYEDESIEEIKKGALEAIRKAISRFKGSKIMSTPYHENGVFGFIENVDHEVLFDHEGTYEFRAKEGDHA